MNTKLDALNNNSEDQHKIKVAVINSIPAKTPDDLELLNKAIQGSQAAKLQLVSFSHFQSIISVNPIVKKCQQRSSFGPHKKR